MSNRLSYRIAFGVILGISIIYGWWYVTIPLAVLGAWMFPYFGELLVLAFMHDCLYSGYFYTLGAGIILCITSLFKVAVR